MAATRRRFGKVRKLPSGKYQASFVGPTGTRQNAPQTFRTRTDAARWLAQVEADLSRGTWLNDNLAGNRSAPMPGPGYATNPGSDPVTGKPVNVTCGCI